HRPASAQAGRCVSQIDERDCPVGVRLVSPSLRLRPHARALAGVLEKLDVNDVRIAADRAVLDVLLFAAAGRIERDHDLLAAGWTHISAFITGSTAFLLPLLHKKDNHGGTETRRRARLPGAPPCLRASVVQPYFDSAGLKSAS